ncbi:E3 ubiquitin-protein ligase ATL4 [Sesamum alatum]|uniref:E3 ubiquitin-protein ligase ATL4 n=1 Tax=Sesamum alatum TaxID=300844 RepID=A0AAE1XR60_9LAMI|nr:E3 ubiquitin-protein ligase ATL4 [Sesamum alatum]
MSLPNGLIFNYLNSLHLSLNTFSHIMSTSFAQPLPATVSEGGSVAPSALLTQLPPPDVDPPSPYSSSASASASSSSVIIVLIIIGSAVIVSASIYLLLRFLSKRLRRTFSAADDVVVRQGASSNRNWNQQHCHVAFNGLLDSLPLFNFRSVAGNLAGGDCAVCLSKFEPHDQLRLLPLCCHAFHAACIDTWIVSNQTCPLCRSTVLPSSSDVLDKILSGGNRCSSNDSFRNENENGHGGSFRIEIGSISHRRGGAEEAVEGGQRSYSVGSFEYIMDDNGYEVSIAGCTTQRRGLPNSIQNDKDSSVAAPVPDPGGEILAAEVSGGRNWLREYMDRLPSVSFSSRAMSFRNSGRFFSSSSSRRRGEAAVVPEDLEANRVGEEISELFRWLSGI